MSRTRSTTAFTSALGLAVLLGCMAVAGGSFSGIGHATKPSSSTQQSQPAMVFRLLDAQSSPAVFAHASSTRDALGFPVGASRSGKHVQDGFEHAEYDEIDELDATGQPISMTQLDKSGRLISAVRFDEIAHPASRISRDAALQTARKGATSAGVTVTGTTYADVDQATDGWTVRWSRIQDGIAVRGDETRVQIRPDGCIQSLARTEHQLAAAPLRQIKADEARQRVANTADEWFTARGSSYTIDSMDLEWVGPNGAFDVTKPIDPQPVYSLARVANVKPSGDASKYLWLATVYIDAGNGGVIGGDFVE